MLKMEFYLRSDILLPQVTTPLMKCKNTSQTFQPNFKQEGEKLVLLGDFNINLLQSNQHKETDCFLDAIITSQLIPKITLPTR